LYRRRGPFQEFRYSYSRRGVVLVLLRWWRWWSGETIKRNWVVAAAAVVVVVGTRCSMLHSSTTSTTNSYTTSISTTSCRGLRPTSPCPPPISIRCGTGVQLIRPHHGAAATETVCCCSKIRCGMYLTLLDQIKMDC
jgi:hypothetical protein